MSSNIFRKALGKMRELIAGAFSSNVPEQIFEELYDRMILADVGPAETSRILDEVRAGKPKDAPAVHTALRGVLLNCLQNSSAAEPCFADHSPTVWFVLGTNGAGKTTTAAKLARYYKNEGKTVSLVAADTFRAAAIEQLAVWAERADVPLFKMQEGAPPAAVLYDALSNKKISSCDLIIVDTAGRLHTRAPLVEELAKMKRISEKLLPGALREQFLVIDGVSGQNAVSQARVFHESLGVSGLIVTKLDASGKAGFLFAATRELSIPVKFAGVGETLEDLIRFVPEDFVDGISGDPPSA